MKPLNSTPKPNVARYGPFGLMDREAAAIRRVLAAQPHIERAVVFGSRAMGTYREGSDVDLALFGSQLTLDDLSRVWAQLDDLDILLRCDVVIYQQLTNNGLREHIDRVGQVFWER